MHTLEMASRRVKRSEICDSKVLVKDIRDIFDLIALKVNLRHSVYLQFIRKCDLNKYDFFSQ